MSPERSEIRTAQLRKRARRALSAAGIKVGGDHLIEPIVNAIAAECEALRDRAGHIFDALIRRGDRLVPAKNPSQKEALEDLRDMVCGHWVDEKGTIRADVDDGDA